MRSTLLAVTAHLAELNPDETIYAIAPWNPQSHAALATEPAGSIVPIDLAADGYSYFIEVFIAQEFVDGLRRSNSKMSNAQICDRLIYYAERDA